MTTSLLKLCTKTCARILFDNSPNRKILDEYTREELSLIIERIKVIRYILKVKRFNRTNIALFKFQEMIHKVLWTLGVYDLEVVAYELEKYIINNVLYNDIKEAASLDIKYAYSKIRDSDLLDIVYNLFDSSVDPKYIDSVLELGEHILTEYNEYLSEDIIEMMNDNDAVKYIAKLVYIDNIVLDHIKERLK